MVLLVIRLRQFWGFFKVKIQNENDQQSNQIVHQTIANSLLVIVDLMSYL